MYKLFEKAGGDLSVSQAKNYAKDPRHLVLLNGYQLKERPASPPMTSNSNISLSSPSDSQLATQGASGISQGYRPPTGKCFFFLMITLQKH